MGDDRQEASDSSNSESNAAVGERLRAQEAFYKSIIEGGADVTTMLAPDGTVLYASATIANEQTSLGYDPKEVIGRNTLDLIHPDDRPAVVQAMMNDLAGKPTTVEARVRRRDGSWIWVEMRGKAMVDLDGKQVVVGYSRNIDQRKRLEERLKSSEEYYRSILQGSSDLINVTDRSGIVLFANDSIERILGYQPQEVLGKQILTYVHEDDVPTAIQQLRDVTTSGTPLIEMRIRRKDGTFCPCEGTGKIITGPDGSSLVLINTRDISERRRLDRERALLAAIVESSDDAIVSNSLDQRITTWNKGAERLFGYTAQEAIGQRASLYMPLELRKWGEGFLDELKNHLDRVRSFEVPCLCKDGRRIDVWTVCGPIRDRNGKLVGISAIHRDLTERKRADREQALLAALVKSSEDAIVSYSTDLQITSWNRGAQRLLGYTAEEAIGKRPFDLYIPPADRAKDQERLAQDLARIRQNPDAMRQFEMPVLTKDGRILDTTVVGCGIHDSEGKLIGLSTILHDVTDRKRVERENAALAAIVESSDDAINSTGLDGRITYWNRGAEKMFGFTAADAIGKPITLHIPPERNAHAAEVTSFLIAHPDEVVRFEGPNIRKDGQLLEVSTVCFAIRDRAGRVVAISAIQRDITERKRAERDAALLGAIVNASQDAIINVSQDLRILSWNPAAAMAYGYTDSEAIGKSIELFVPPDELQETIARAARVAQTGQPVSWEQHARSRDGREFVSAVNIFPIRDETGKIISVAGIGRDITVRKQAERQLALLAAIVNASQDAIMNVSSDSRIVFWNPAATKAYGYTADEAIGKSIALFVAPEELPETIERTRRVVETGQPVSWEQQAVRRDGSRFISAVNVFPMRDEGGNITSVAGIGRDMTALKETQRELVAAREAALAASQAKSEFLSSMSHEIRTPMTAILGMAELLAEGELNPEQRRYIEILDNNGHALLDLINSILDLAKIESGRLTLEHVAFDLCEVVEKAAQTLAIRAHAKGLELIVTIAPDVPTALIGDPLRLRQVLINLIGNAIKFTEKGEVVVSVERDSTPSEPTLLKFCVRDTGIGIAKDKLPLLFETFSQADSSTARKYGGSGLGLAIVKRLVGLMNGEVSLESELGKGSIFTFTAPLEPDPNGRAAARSWPDLARVPVLLVVGNEIERQILHGVLSERGASATEVASYEEGLIILRRAFGEGRSPRFILLDDRIGSPNLSAMEQLVASASQCGASIIAMIHSDNLAADTARLKALKLGTYLVKPIDTRELAKLVRHVVIGDEPVEALEVRSPIASDGVKPPIVERPLKILFADDSIDNRTLIRTFLKKTPYHLIEVENGRQAIDSFIEAGDYDLVLMDIQMPEVDGYAATHAIRDWEREHNHAHTPIIALTASVFPEAIRLAKAAGCDGHLGKPISKKILLRAIYDAVTASSPTARPTATP